MPVETADSTSTIDDPTADKPAGNDAIIEISDAAMAVVLDARATEDEPTEYVLRIEITGAQGVDFVYELAFERRNALVDDEVEISIGDLIVAVPPSSIPNLQGSTLDVAKTGGGLVIRNPNRPDPLAGLDLELTGDLAEKVQKLLDVSINPGLAEHGGFATLIGVDDTRVFITMGGGCQGCAMSRMTLTEGIQRSIVAAIPEVTEVVDATDHAAGENPFFE